VLRVVGQRFPRTGRGTLDLFKQCHLVPRSIPKSRGLLKILHSLGREPGIRGRSGVSVPLP